MDTVDERIGQKLMIGFHGYDAPDYLLEWLTAGKIGGVILFSRNIQSPEQVLKLTRNLHNAAKYPLLIAIDQEGGVVARLRQGFTESPGAMALGAANDNNLAQEMAQVLGTEMRSLGINWDFAPVVDLPHNIENTSVGVRALGRHADRVAALAIAQIQGFQATGVAATAKHFPGLGNTPVDTHVDLAVIDDPLSDLWARDLVPFRAVVEAEVATVMVSHVKFPEIDAHYPATLSPAIINGLLRQDIGFKGVTCTDCMEMRAIADHFGTAESAVQAALAGNDIILISHSMHPDHPMADYVFSSMRQATLDGSLSEKTLDESLQRIHELKRTFAVQDDLSLKPIRSEQHLVIARRAARAGMVAVKTGASIPVVSEKSLGLIEFASVMDSDVMESGGLTGLVQDFLQRWPHASAISLPSRAIPHDLVAQATDIATSHDLLVIATRNAHLNREQKALAQSLSRRAQNTIHLCLRNPYDVGLLPEAESIFCTLGDSTPSLQAAVAALAGDFVPAGTMPVAVAGL